MFGIGARYMMSDRLLPRKRLVRKLRS